MIDDSGELKDLAGIEVEWYNDYAVSEDERTGAVLVTDSMGIASGMAVSGRTGAWKLSVDTLPEGYTADRIKSVWGKAEKDVVIHINLSLIHISLIPGLSLTTRETVLAETPASFAIS